MTVASHAAPNRRYSQLPRFFRWFSDHCVLRQVDESDVQRLLRAVAQPGAAECATVDVPADLQDVEDLIQDARLHWARGTRYTMAVLRKRTHEFVGWVELTPMTSEKGAWALDLFVHPRFAAEPIAVEVATAAADLLFSALEADKLYASCTAAMPRVETILNETGFIQVIPAGSYDQQTGRRLERGLHELGRRDWVEMRRAQSVGRRAGDVTYASNWVNVGMRADVALL